MTTWKNVCGIEGAKLTSTFSNYFLSGLNTQQFSVGASCGAKLLSKHAGKWVVNNMPVAKEGFDPINGYANEEIATKAIYGVYGETMMLKYAQQQKTNHGPEWWKKMSPTLRDTTYLFHGHGVTAAEMIEALFSPAFHEKYLVDGVDFKDDDHGVFCLVWSQLRADVGKSVEELGAIEGDDEEGEEE